MTAHALLSMTGSVTKPLIGVFRGATLNTLTNHNAVRVSPELYLLPAEAGQTYHIAAVSADDDMGPVTIDLSIPPPPANDHFTNSVLLTNNHITSFADMLNATREPGEPAHGRWGGTATVWYSWTASSHGVARFEVPYGAEVSVNTGNHLQTLQQVDLLRASNLDLVFRVGAGTTYHFAIAANAPTLGTEFAFDFPRFGGVEDAQLLHGADLQVNGLPASWWIWDAPASGMAKLSRSNMSSGWVGFVVYSGTFGINPIAEGSSSVEFSAVAGRRYYIQANGSLLTNLTFHLQLLASTPPIVDVGYSGGQFGFTFGGTPGESFQLLTSTNLVDWFPAGLHTFYGPLYPFIDPNPTGGARFYRAGAIR
jgi:hypothetical protein